MNKYFKLSLLALFVGFASCEDATDIVQESELGETNAYRNVDDLRSGLIGVYATYAPDAGGNGAGDIILFNELFTDNIKRGESSSGQGNQEYNFILRPNTDFPERLWSNRYGVINFANRVLRAWDRIVPGLTNAEDIDRANEIKAQLLAFRALCHLELLQYYSPNYERNSQGVIIMNFVPEPSQVFPRNTVGEVFDFINQDLAQATTLIDDFSSLPDYTTDDAEVVYYINPDVIKAIRTRVALFEENYTLAETLAEELIADYPLAAFGPYSEMFLSDTFSSELIFSLSRRQGDRGVAGLFYANTVDIDGSPFFELSNQLLNLYSANDVRRIVMLAPTSVEVGTDSPENILLIGKYPGSTDGPLINDIKLFRSSEMYLIKAECEARLGKFDEAEQSIQAIRSARLISGTAPAPEYGTDLTVALTDVLLERRKELAFEGHRYLDLKRLGPDTGIGINRNSVDCASFSAQQCILLPGDFRFTLPIPTSELAANPGIQQNPNY